MARGSLLIHSDNHYRFHTCKSRAISLVVVFVAAILDFWLDMWLTQSIVRPFVDKTARLLHMRAVSMENISRMVSAIWTLLGLGGSCLGLVIWYLIDSLLIACGISEGLKAIRKAYDSGELSVDSASNHTSERG